MYRKDLISIILPVYNGEKFLAETLKSCLNQTYNNFEVIFIDDCSTDSSLKIANEFSKKDDRIKLFENKKNLQLPASLNRGHKNASGKYITWLSHDNLLKSNFLEALYNSIISTNADIVYSNFDVLLEDGGKYRTHIPGPPEFLVFGNQVGPSFLYRREVFQELKGYKEELFLVEDYDFWLRASLIFCYQKLEENLYSYRLQSESLTRKIFSQEKYKKDHEIAFEKMFRNFRQQVKWEDVTLNFILELQKKQRKALYLFAENQEIIKRDLKEYCKGALMFPELWKGVISNLRTIIHINFGIKLLPILFQLLKKEKGIFFPATFSRKNNMKFIIAKFLNG